MIDAYPPSAFATTTSFHPGRSHQISHIGVAKNSSWSKYECHSAHPGGSKSRPPPESLPRFEISTCGEYAEAIAYPVANMDFSKNVLVAVKGQVMVEPLGAVTRDRKRDLVTESQSPALRVDRSP